MKPSLAPSAQARLDARERPRTPPRLRQRWHDLAFFHWAWSPDDLAARLPSGLHLDTYEDSAYIGLVPFRMTGVRPRGFPAIPPFSRFHEINVRTYVYDDYGRPGVWFFSLDAADRLAVRVARRFFHLPYAYARIGHQRDGDLITYHTTRPWLAQTSELCYRLGPPWGEAEPESLEFFLVERYRLFTYDERRGRLLTGRVWHEPYPLRSLQWVSGDTRLLGWNGLDEPLRLPDHGVFANHVDVHIFNVEAVDTRAGR